MLVVLIITELTLLLRFIAIIMYKIYLQDHPEDKTHNYYYRFDKATTIILVVIYSVTSLIFIPLFFIILRKLKQDYANTYQLIKCKLYAVFAILILFLVIRFYVYIIVKYKPNLVSQDTLVAEIPFYVSEIIITITISYILLSVSKIEATSEAEE